MISSSVVWAVLAWIPLTVGGQIPPLWNDYLEAKANHTQPELPDFSYAGYRFSEVPLPDVTDRPHFDVTDYGAVPDDDTHYDDDAIQAAIHAAEENSGGVVFFPPGRYLIGDPNRRRPIRVAQSNIVLKGSGADPGGTELFAREMRVARPRLHFAPARRSTSLITTVTNDAPRQSYWVEVADASELRVGQDIELRHQSEEFTRQYFAPLPLAPEWTRLFGPRGGMKIGEIHTIAEIDGRRVRFVNPIQFDLRQIQGQPFALHRYEALRDCGIENILFRGHWDSYPEEFVHHQDGIHDSGWVALSMEHIQDSWIRDCDFRNWNECVFTRAAYRTTITDVMFSGKKGHTSVHARGGYGVLIKNCEFNAGHHHGPGGGYGSVSLVVTQCRMRPDQNIDLHSGQSYASLYDDIDGGVLRNLGGPWPGLPHGGRDLVFWNFRHRSTYDFHYNFWDVTRRRNHTFADPIFVGFRADRRITFENEGINQLPGTNVEPRSLFEAQLAHRLTSLRQRHSPSASDVRRSPEASAPLEAGAVHEIVDAPRPDS